MTYFVSATLLTMSECSDGQPIPTWRSIPAYSGEDRYIEINRRRELDNARRLRVEMLTDIEYYSKQADSTTSPGYANELRQHVAQLRALVPVYERLERRLWELQPGGITAPAPRPVRRGD